MHSPNNVKTTTFLWNSITLINWMVIISWKCCKVLSFSHLSVAHKNRCYSFQWNILNKYKGKSNQKGCANIWFWSFMNWLNFLVVWHSFWVSRLQMHVQSNCRIEIIGLYCLFWMVTNLSVLNVFVQSNNFNLDHIFWCKFA